MDGKSNSPQFQTTHWSLVLAAGRDTREDSHRALAALCEAYWFPLYAYVRRRVGGVHEAEDTTQEFFARLLSKNTVAAADPDRGRFRSFLLTSLKNFLANEWDKAKAQKRGGGRAPISLDFAKADLKYNLEPADRETPERLYHRQWTMTLLDHVMTRLRVERQVAGKLLEFDTLKLFIVGGKIAGGYSEAAGILAVSEEAAKAAAYRLRKRYRELLRHEIAQTVATADEVDDEIGRLFSSLEP
jgi:RNA polymerase sigma factor (sigma-70 family)